MAALPIVLTVASTAVSALGAISAANAQRASYESQAAAQKYNATIEAQNADVARQQANAREEQLRRQQRQMFGIQRAAIAQSGTGPGGSNLDVAEQSATLAELDALNVRYEGALQARGLLAQSALDRYQARASQMNASNAMTAGYLSAGAALLKAPADYYGLKRLKSGLA